MTPVRHVVTCARRLRRTCVAAMCFCRRLREYVCVCVCVCVFVCVYIIYIYIYIWRSLRLASQNASSFVLVSKYFCTREQVLLNLDLEVGFADLN